MIYAKMQKQFHLQYRLHRSYRSTCFFMHSCTVFLFPYSCKQSTSLNVPTVVSCTVSPRLKTTSTDRTTASVLTLYCPRKLDVTFPIDKIKKKKIKLVVTL